MAIKITGTTIIDDSLNITSSVGTVDGRNVATDGTKLDSIETAATADQTGAQIKAAYQNEASAFTDAQFTKLGAIESYSKDDQTGAEIKALYENETNAFTNALYVKLGTIETNSKDDQTGAEIKALYEAEASAFTNALFTKLGTIEVDSKDDQTAVEIKALYEAEASAFTDAQFTKLGGIETAATADQTDAEIKASVEGATDISLGGSPTTTTQSPLDNSTKIATTAYADSAIAALVDSAPATLNTLSEIAAALASGEGVANSLTATVSTKMPLAGGAFSGAVTTSSTFDGRAVATDGTKLDGIETAATADQTGSEIKVAYEAEADTNAFTDAQLTKLGTIENSATADQTGAQIKAAYEAETNAFTDALFTKLGGIAESATNVTNNNQLTNGEGFITSYVDTTYTGGTGITLSGTTFNCDINTPAEVGLGNLSSSGNNLAGDFTATGNITAYSDASLKSNVEEIPNALEKVLSIRGVTFDMNGERGTGVIAQELEQVLPEAVFDNDSGLKSVAYGNVVGLLIESIKKQQEQIDFLMSQLGGE